MEKIKIKANRNVRISFYSGRYAIKQGTILPCDNIPIEASEIKELSHNPAFDEIKELKKKSKE